MKTRTNPPKNVSSNVVRSYYYSEFDQNEAFNSGIIIDDACYELMFVKENNIQITTGDDETFLIPPCYTLNNLKGPFKFSFKETFSTFCIKLQPWFNASFVPIEKSQVLNLKTLYPKSTDELHKKLFASDSLDEMSAHAEEFLLAITITPTKETILVKEICDLIYKKSGIVTVTEIADHFNIYRQKLNQIFKQEVKYTLKNFIDCIRIRACIKFKFQNPEISLTEIGYNYGYYDQAHFIHAFRNASGVSPSEYIKTPGYSSRS